MNVEESHTATVTSIDDPDKRGRIKVSCPGLMGSDDEDDVGGQLPMWVEPCYTWGWFIVPDVGETVEIVVYISGDDDESFKQGALESLNPRWRGERYWTDPEAETARTVPEDFTATNYGKRRGLATPQGHVLMFDDTEGKEKISITWHGKREGVDAFSFFSLDENGSVLMANRNGSLLYMNATPDEQQVVLIDEWGNSITMSEEGITLVDHFSNMITMADGLIQVISQGGVVLEASSGIKVGGNATMHMLLGETLIAAIDAMLAAGVPTALDGGAGLKATMIAGWNAIKNTSLAVKGYVE